jgi:hypothetical protein
MTLKLWLLLAAYAAFWVVASYILQRIIRKESAANLAALHAAAVTTWIPAGLGTLACQHMTISGVQSAACGHCGPLVRVP